MFDLVINEYNHGTMSTLLNTCRHIFKPVNIPLGQTCILGSGFLKDSLELKALGFPKLIFLEPTLVCHHCWNYGFPYRVL